MRLWHYKLLSYLPDAQFKGQLRELVAIMKQWRDTGKTNHLLINRVMECRKGALTDYFAGYCLEYKERYGKPVSRDIRCRFKEFSPCLHYPEAPYPNWHDRTYLRICMANLYEKYMGIGESRITQEEWEVLMYGYEKITGERYII